MSNSYRTKIGSSRSARAGCPRFARALCAPTWESYWVAQRLSAASEAAKSRVPHTTRLSLCGLVAEFENAVRTTVEERPFRAASRAPKKRASAPVLEQPARAFRDLGSSIRRAVSNNPAVGWCEPPRESERLPNSSLDRSADRESLQANSAVCRKTRAANAEDGAQSL